MASQLTPGAIVEVSLPSNYPTQQCLPLVVMQPSGPLSDYLLASEYATNGQAGVVDEAVLAQSVETVDWSQITDIPSSFSPSIHAFDHLASGGDPFPDRLEGTVTITSGMGNGTVLFTGVIPNPSPGVYSVLRAFVYNAAQSPAPAGMVHFDVYDRDSSSWIAATGSLNLATLTSIQALIQATLLTGVTSRTFEAGASQLTWRLVLDVAPGSGVVFDAGMQFMVYAISSL
jgi:hypothetical protein